MLKITRPKQLNQKSGIYAAEEKTFENGVKAFVLYIADSPRLVMTCDDLKKYSEDGKDIGFPIISYMIESCFHHKGANSYDYSVRKFDSYNKAYAALQDEAFRIEGEYQALHYAVRDDYVAEWFLSVIAAPEWDPDDYEEVQSWPAGFPNTPGSLEITYSDVLNRRIGPKLRQFYKEGTEPFPQCLAKN